MTPKLNIPTSTNSKENQFEMVSFVNTMSHYSLKVLVKRLWENLHTLANAVEEDRADISMALDQILSGQGWSVKSLKTRYSYMIKDGEIIQFDTKTNEFTVLRVEDSDWVKSIPEKGMNYQELVKAIKRG